MDLFNSFRVANFRGFEDLQLSELRRLNLIVGRNNAGKTSLLEAIGLALWAKRGPHPAELRGKPTGAYWEFALPVGTQRTMSAFRLDWEHGTRAVRWPVEGARDDEVQWFRHAFSKGRHDRRQATVGETETITFGSDRPTPVSIVSCFPPDPDAELARFDRAMVSADAEHRIEQLLATLDSRVRTIRALAASDKERRLYVDIGLPKRVAISALGQGMQRLLALATHGYEAEGGVLLIDEIENGLHHAYFDQLWHGLRVLAIRLNLQVFATTHSYECLAAATASAPTADAFAVHRLQRTQDGQIEAVTLTGERLLNAVQQGVELR